MIKPWVFEFFTALDGEPGADSDVTRWAEAYQWYQQLWQGFENAGFEGLFFSEHHFMPGRLSPSPNLLIAAMAPMTKRLRLGVMGMVAPLYAPWRLAEEVAMLDHLTQGRLEIGLSSGTGPMEYKAVGMAADEVRDRFAETMDILQAAMTQPKFSHRGRFWQFDNLAISPRPMQQPTPPCWITGLSTQTAALAALRGYKLCTAFLSIAEIQNIFNAYRDTAAQSGRATTPDDLGIRRVILVSDDDSEGREIARNAVNLWRSTMSGLQGDKAHALPKTVVADAPKVGHGPSIADEEAIGGSPATVAEQIIEQCRATGAGHILGYTFGTLSRAQVERNYQLWREVIPILRQANL